MIKIFKYCFFDLFRSRWNFIYFGFFFIITGGFFTLGGGPEKVVISLTNISLVLVPLVATMFSVIYFFNAREFTELLLAQPIPRKWIFTGQYLGVAVSLSLAYVLGVGIPFLIWNGFQAGMAVLLVYLLLAGIFLNFIFTAIALFIALRNDNRIKGFGLALLVWLFFTVLYDGLFLVILLIFKDYPLEQVSLAAVVLNPVDLARMFILLKLDISALFGYSGAIFEHFLGSTLGIAIATGLLLIWTYLPAAAFLRTASKKDF